MSKTLGTAVLIASALAAPAPAAEVTGGNTDVRLDAFPALSAEGFVAEATGSAILNFDGEVPIFTFPITSGSATMDNTILNHAGSGIRFTLDSDTLDIGNFVINTDAMLVSGDASANGSSLGFVPLFDIGEGLSLSLTEVAADAFEDVFDLDENAFGDDLEDITLGSANPSPVIDHTAAVPEPSTWALMLLGFGAIGGAMRMRKRRRVTVAYARGTHHFLKRR